MNADAAKQWLDDMPMPKLDDLQPLYDVYGAEPPFGIHVQMYTEKNSWGERYNQFSAYIGRYPDIQDALIETGFHDTASEARHALQITLNDLVPLSDKVKQMEAELRGARMVIKHLDRVKFILGNGDDE